MRSRTDELICPYLWNGITQIYNMYYNYIMQPLTYLDTAVQTGRLDGFQCCVALLFLSSFVLGMFVLTKLNGVSNGRMIH
jgi:hypothetical protein